MSRGNVSQILAELRWPDHFPLPQLAPAMRKSAARKEWHNCPHHFVYRGYP